MQTTVKMDIKDINELKRLFVGFSPSKAIKALLLEREDRLTKKHILSFIDSKFNAYIKSLESRLKDTIGDF